MSLNSLAASRVIKEVLDYYEQYLPLGLAAKVRTLNPARIFHILPESQYKPHFDAYYRSFFAAINVVALGPPVDRGGGTQSLIGIATDRTRNVYESFACPAFCAPAVEVTQRRIYVNKDSGVTVGTLYHEFVHFLEHANFYPEMYAMGGASPKILEGVTEYLTRRISPTIASERAAGNKYQAWYAFVTNTITGDKVSERLARMAFQGDLREVPALGGTVPMAT